MDIMPHLIGAKCPQGLRQLGERCASGAIGNRRSMETRSQTEPRLQRAVFADFTTFSLHSAPARDPDVLNPVKRVIDSTK